VLEIDAQLVGGDDRMEEVEALNQDVERRDTDADDERQPRTGVPVSVGKLFTDRFLGPVYIELRGAVFMIEVKSLTSTHTRSLV